MSGALRPGQAWGHPTTDPPDLELGGGDRALAAVLESGGSDPLIHFVPAADSDLARAIGLIAGAAQHGLALPLDVIDVAADGLVAVAVNSVVVGVAPDRLRVWHRSAELRVEIDGAPVDAGSATSVLVMNGQYLRGLDVSPRGHPGDGVGEAQLYALPPGARRAMRTRLATGAHLPHPAITTRKVRHAVFRAARPVLLEIDGSPAGPVRTLELGLRPAAYRLLV